MTLIILCQPLNVLKDIAVQYLRLNLIEDNYEVVVSNGADIRLARCIDVIENIDIKSSEHPETVFIISKTPENFIGISEHRKLLKKAVENLKNKFSFSKVEGAIIDGTNLGLCILR